MPEARRASALFLRCRAMPRVDARRYAIAIFSRRAAAMPRSDATFSARYAAAARYFDGALSAFDFAAPDARRHAAFHASPSLFALRTLMPPRRRHCAAFLIDDFLRRQRFLFSFSFSEADLIFRDAARFAARATRYARHFAILTPYASASADAFAVFAAIRAADIDVAAAAQIRFRRCCRHCAAAASAPLCAAAI